MEKAFAFVVLLCTVDAQEEVKYPLGAEPAWRLGTKQYERVRDRTQGWQKKDTTECYTGNEARRARAAPREPFPPRPRAALLPVDGLLRPRGERAASRAPSRAPRGRRAPRAQCLEATDKKDHWRCQGPWYCAKTEVGQEFGDDMDSHGERNKRANVAARRRTPLRRGPRFETISLTIERRATRRRRSQNIERRATRRRRSQNIERRATRRRRSHRVERTEPPNGGHARPAQVMIRGCANISQCFPGASARRRRDEARSVVGRGRDVSARDRSAVGRGPRRSERPPSRASAPARPRRPAPQATPTSTRARTKNWRTAGRRRSAARRGADARAPARAHARPQASR